MSIVKPIHANIEMVRAPSFGSKPLFELTMPAQPVMVCERAERLADWAFEHNASEVRFSYDLSVVPDWWFAAEVRPLEVHERKAA